MKTLLLLCWEFFKTGLFAIGGGMATVPFLQEMSRNYGWFTIEELTTMIAVSESTPGPIGVNIATYVGNHMFGPIGGVLATISLVLPSVIVVIIVSKVLEQFKNSQTVKGIFMGLRPAAIGFIASAALSIFVVALLNIPAYQSSGSIMDLIPIPQLIFFIALGIFYYFQPKTHPLILVMIGVVIGIVFHF